MTVCMSKSTPHDKLLARYHHLSAHQIFKLFLNFQKPLTYDNDLKSIEHSCRISASFQVSNRIIVALFTKRNNIVQVGVCMSA